MTLPKRTMTTAATAATARIDLSRVQMRDLPAVVRLEKLSFGPDAWGWVDFLAAHNPGNIFIKATLDSQLVGFILAQPNRRAGLTWISNIAVHPDVRNQGIGRRLMEVVEQMAATPRLRLTVRVDNAPARRLYRSLGYVEVTLRRRYYRGQVDGMEMEKVVG